MLLKLMDNLCYLFTVQRINYDFMINKSFKMTFLFI